MTKNIRKEVKAIFELAKKRKWAFNQSNESVWLSPPGQNFPQVGTYCVELNSKLDLKFTQDETKFAKTFFESHPLFNSSVVQQGRALQYIQEFLRID